MKVELLIQWLDTCYEPVTLDGITWTLERKGTPGKLEFTVLKDSKLRFEEGASVRLKVNDTNLFYGFVFKKTYDKDKNIKVTAYDQLRYLKNKDTYVYKNKTATELVELLIPGEDEEDTESIRKRYYQSLEAESYGGNKIDYKIKVGLIKGVGGVKVYSGHEWNGGGTVKIVITDSDFEKPTDTLVKSVQKEVDPVATPGEGIGIAPIGHIVTVVGVNEVEIDISTQIIYQPGYYFEAVKTDLEKAVDEYLQGLNSVWEDENNIIVRISQLETRILGVKGVLDVMNTTINGVSENYTVHKDSIVKRGELTDGN